MHAEHPAYAAGAFLQIFGVAHIDARIAQPHVSADGLHGVADVIRKPFQKIGAVEPLEIYFAKANEQNLSHAYFLLKRRKTG